MLSAARSEIKKAENRLFEIERIIVKLYEEKVCGTMPEERFDLLAKNYETEQVGTDSGLNFMVKKPTIYFKCCSQ